MSGSSVADRLVKEIQSRRQLVIESSRAGIDVTDLQENQCGAIVTAILAQGHITADDGVVVQQLLGADTTFTKQQRQRMVVAIAEANCRPVHKGGGKGRSTQSCISFEDYQTAADWARYNDPTLSTWAKCGIMADRLYALNCPCPDAKLLKKCSSIISACAKDEIPAGDRRQLAIDVQTAVKSQDKQQRKGWQHLTEFPLSPLSLPDLILNEAYGSDRPIDCPPETKKRNE